MLEITNERGQVLDLPDNYSLSVEKNNPLFNDPEKFFQDVSYAGNAPLSPANKLFFNNAHLVETANAAYEQQVYVSLGSAQLFQAACSCITNADNFEFTLKPNFAAINKMLQQARLTELQTADANYTVGSTRDLFGQHMLDTCSSPDAYPYAFIPVYNEDFNKVDGLNRVNQKVVNKYDYTTQKFKLMSLTTDEGDFAECPFYKVVYMVTKVLAALGFKATGDFFTNADDKSLYIYTRTAVSYFTKSHNIMGSSYYMPNILIKDFIIKLRERLHLAFDFDLGSGSCEVQSFDSMMASPVLFNFDRYLEYLTEMKTPEQKGFLVTLKPDEQDEMTTYDGTSENKAMPDFRLIAGDAATAVEVDCATLATGDYKVNGDKLPITQAKQPVNNVNYLSFKNFELTDPEDPTTLNNWPLRLIRYKGYLQQASGKMWPASEPFNLDTRDLTWYRFLNDCKLVKLRVNIPPVILTQMKTTGKYSFTTAEGCYTECIIERISYTIAKTTELMPVDIYVRTINFQTGTKAFVEPVQKPVAQGSAPERMGVLFKAYFDQDLHRISSVQVNVTGPQYKYTVDTITASTDKSGFGGKGKYMAQTGYLANSFEPSFQATVSVSQGTPKFLEYLGKRYYFSGGSVSVYFEVEAGINTAWISY